MIKSSSKRVFSASKPYNVGLKVVRLKNFWKKQIVYPRSLLFSSTLVSTQHGTFV